MASNTKNTTKIVTLNEGIIQLEYHTINGKRMILKNTAIINSSSVSNPNWLRMIMVGSIIKINPAKTRNPVIPKR